MKTKARVTKARLRPFNLTVIGAIIKPTMAADKPAKGNQKIISRSNPITLEVATPPITAEV